MLTPEMLWRLKKPVRTAQSYFPSLKDAKDGFYRSYRRLLRQPSEPFFKAIRIFSHTLKGCCIDVGGNNGQSIESISLYAPLAKVISFEPNPILARKLRERYKDNLFVTVRDVGLSNKPGMMELHVPSYRGFVYDGLASLDYASAKGWLSPETLYFFDKKRLSVQSFECRIETLDMQNLNPSFIKIDVEGTEAAVLEGGIETLRRYRPVLLIEGAHEKPGIGQITKYLGYHPYTFDGTSFRAGYASNSTFFIADDTMRAITDASVEEVAS